MRGRGVRLAPLGAHLASTGLRSVLVWEPEKGKRQTYFLKKRKKSNRQTGGSFLPFPGPTSQGTDSRAPHALEGSTSPARAPAPPGRGPPPPRSATGEAGSRARAPQGPLDPDQLNYGYENRSVSPRIFNPSLSCGRALATRDHISKESCGGPVYVCHFQNQAEETEAN